MLPKLDFYYLPRDRIPFQNNYTFKIRYGLTHWMNNEIQLSRHWSLVDAKYKNSIAMTCYDISETVRNADPLFEFLGHIQ